MRHKNFYQVNENYFDEINSHDKAYVLGFILADGYIGKYELSISLQEGDKEVLDFIKKQLNYNGSVKRFAGRIDKRNGNVNQGQVSLRIHSKKLLDNLREKYNLSNNKSQDLVLPDIDNEFLNSLLLGFFDGDGHIYRSKHNQYQLAITSTEVACNQVQDILMRNCNLSNRKVYKLQNCYSIRYCGISVIGRIRDYLYKDCSFSLSRKRIKLEEMKYKRNPNKLIKF